jgi:hypothetical protein
MKNQENNNKSSKPSTAEDDVEYNEKEKVIRIKSYPNDPKRVGDKMVIGVLSKKGPREPRGMPKWFKDWSEVEFKPMRADVADLKVRMTNVETRLTNVETAQKEQGEKLGQLSQKLDRVIKLNNLKS